MIKKEFVKLKKYLKTIYYSNLLNNSTNFVLMGYDEINENPTYLNYYILANVDNQLQIMAEFSLYNCNSTMILTVAQDQVAKLNLMGFNEELYSEVRNIIFELFDEFDTSNELNEDIIKAIDERLHFKINELKLKNLEDLVEYIEFLPDSEVLQLLDILVQLTEIKMKFSSEVHSVGGKRIKAVLRKYDGVKFFE